MGNVAELVGVPGIDPDLERAERDLRHAVATADPFLSEVAGHLVGAGGKRLRPALAISAALACGREVTDDVISGGVSVELVHIGSLYHDDVMENADVRRGVPTVNATWGNLVAIVAGDFLLARASEIAAGLGSQVAGVLAATIRRLCEGQLAELRTAFQLDRDEDAYFASIRGKTASLLSSSCRIGAMTAGVTREETAALAEFGESFGMVFQIYDDMLDIVSTEAELGKPVGIDAAGGVYTLPLLRALRDPVAGPELRRMLGTPLGLPERDKVRDIVRQTSGIAEALEVARGFADSAAAALAPLNGRAEAAGLAGLGHRLLDGLTI